MWKKHLNPNGVVDYNKRVHDSLVASYERIHTEIYNPTEQARIPRVLGEAVSHIDTASDIPSVLDFGAGTGNLTAHLLNLGARVLAADVSPKCLVALKGTFGGTGMIDFMELNGVDLSNLGDDCVDMVATYSVLHHVPDYLRIVKEFARVVRPGGVIYIDHESAPCVWNEDCGDLEAYRKEMQRVCRQPAVSRVARKLRLAFSRDAWRRLLNRTLFGLGREGDIHVFENDHIEWDRIESVLAGQCVLLKQEDYLVCRELDPNPLLYAKHRRKCADMRVAIYRKKR